MKHDVPAFLHRLPALRLVGGSLVLLYLLTATPLTPVLTALLAVADRSHQIAIQRSARGIQVVLRHDCLNAPTHRHGVVARALTLVAQPLTKGHPDHVIQFAASATTDQATALTIAPMAPASAAGPLSLSSIQPRTAWLFAMLTGLGCPPSDTSGALVNVRSTVLLL